jgi:hypothetical protein
VPDYRKLLGDHRCWDRGAQDALESQGEGGVDCLQQNREEVIALCEFIEAHGVRSYLEIGVWTGRLVGALHRIFRFDLVAACDQGRAQSLGLPLVLPSDCHFFRGNSESMAYRRWRAGLGAVDLVFIDANHNYHAIRRDFEINRSLPHRFLALHDITGANRHTVGVRKLWEEIDHGHKLELLRPHVELGLDHSVMGIGIWSGSEPLKSSTPAGS